MILGFTTGVMYEKINPFSKEIITAIKNTGCNAIELNAVKIDREPALAATGPEDVAGFEYVTIHAPCIQYQNDERTRSVLRLLEQKQRDLKCPWVIFHPDNIDDWNVLKNFNINYAFENNDNRKNSYRTTAEMVKMLAETSYKMVFDVNHCYSNDSTLELAKEMIAACRKSIVEVHISGYRDYHYPLYQTQQDEIIEAVKGLNVPLIIESVLAEMGDLQKEYDYIAERLGKPLQN